MEATVGDERSRFCCYGCVLALQVTRARGESGAAASILIRLGLAIFFAMNVMMVSMPAYVPYVYGSDAGDGPLFRVLRVLALVFAAPVIGLLGWPILAGAARSLGAGIANTDALIALGTLAAYGLSAANTVGGNGPVYFDTAAMLLVLVTLGRYLEAQAKAEAGAAVRAMLAQGPGVATRIRAGSSEQVSSEALLPNDVVRVGPGEAFPTDGRVLEGLGSVDEAVLTGESRPIFKHPESRVAGGTHSIDGLFLVRVTEPAAASAAARIAALLARARRERAPVERLADRVTAVLVPLVVMIAATAALYWVMRKGVDQGLLVGLAVLVVACPCGLGIATPVAVWTGLVAAARRGVIVRSAAALERAADVDTALFDKTGTLTDRTPRLVAIELAAGSGFSEDELLARAAALEAGLTHPLARAIAAAWEERAGLLGGGNPHSSSHGLPPSFRVTDVRTVPGRGVCGRIDGEPFAVGSPQFAAMELGNETKTSEPEHEGLSVVLVWQSRRLIGALHFAEALRPDARPAIDQLRRLGVRVGLLTGDRQVEAVVPTLISTKDAAFGLLPDDKVAYVKAQSRGRSPRTLNTGAVAMIGDGVNDAPALAASDLGIAVGSATDLARITADVAIIADDLERVPWLIDHARRVARVIRQNLFWAFAYNFVAIAIATSGALNPLIASLAMLTSSLAVVANTRRLRLASLAPAPAAGPVVTEKAGN